MILKTAIIAAAALAAAASAIGPNASAASIKYTITVSGSGNFNDDGVLTPFSNLMVQSNTYGDTATLVNDPGVAYFIHLTGGSTTYSGNTYAEMGDAGSSAFVTEAPNSPGVIGYGDFSVGMYGGSLDIYGVLYSPSFVGYDGVSNIGPVAFYPEDHTLGDPWEFEFDAGGTGNNYIDFYNVSSATFSASVPEPATWAMMLVGFGGLGAAMRSRRKQATAA